MGKRRKRLTMAKYAKKYATIREAVFGKKVKPSPVIVEVEPIIEQPKVEEVMVEPKVEAKPAPEPVIEAPKPKPKERVADYLLLNRSKENSVNGKYNNSRNTKGYSV